MRVFDRPRLRGATRAISAVFVAGLVGFGVGMADTVTLEPSRDNTLYETADGSLSNGAGQHVFTGTTATGDIRRAVLAFDVAAAIPAGATITRVTLTLNMSRTISGAQNVELYRLLADWGEGSSNAGGQEGGGAPSMTGDATWIHTFYDTDFWSNAGGDFAAIASASQSVGGTGAYTWGSTPDMVADVQGWLDDPGQNFGWILIGNEAVTGSAKRFDSREHPTSSVRPELLVEYDAPVQAAGRVPDGDEVAGDPLLVTKEAGGDITLDWSSSCLATDTDYEIYEGDLTSPDSHTERFCSTGGATSITFTPAADQRYYLIVPTNGVNEGSYGTDSSGVQRPIGIQVCLPRQIGPCN